MKKKRQFAALAAATAFFLLVGCGNEGEQRIPYPDNYYIHTSPSEEKEETEDAAAEAEALAKDTKTKSTEESDTSLKPEKMDKGEADQETSPEKEAASSEKADSQTTSVQIAKQTSQKTIHYFLDNSASMSRSPEVIHIYSAAIKCAAGYDQRSYYGIGPQKNLVETTEELALAGKYGNGAPLDLIENGTLPSAVDGVNILTTDLQSNTSSSRFGQWLMSTGCTGFTFYVFTMQYDGSLEFETYTSSTNLETVSISDCSFDQKEFLMIVFGENELVQDFDENFQSKLKKEENYDVCHASLQGNSEAESSFLNLTSSKCFQGNLPNITYTNNNYIFGLEEKSVSGVVWTCPNTFVYRKNSKSVGRSKSAVKAVFYAVPEEPLPAVEDAVVTEVLKYNSETKAYEPCEMSFQLETEAYLDGFPTVIREEGQSDKVYEKLQQDLGNSLVASGPVFTAQLENKNLPKGIYAVEAQITFAADGEAANLRNFAEEHSAGLDEYSEALKAECQAKIVDGVTSSSRFRYIGSKSGSSVFCKLLDFERIAEELLAAGAVSEADSKVLTVRMIIDNE